MSKYTTEVRFILEVAAGYTESQDANKIDEIIASTWQSVFTDKYVIGSAMYTEHICQMILKHYYFREICCETVGLWKTWMQTRLHEIIPYYDKLYATIGALSVEKALLDIDLNKRHDGEHSITYTDDTTDDLIFGNNRATTGTIVDDGENHVVNKYSDTPQGGLTGINENRYLTDVRMIDGTDDNTRTHNLNEAKTGKDSRVIDGEKHDDGTDAYVETVKGKYGGKSYSELLKQYRDTLLNMDEMVINEFDDLFMRVY